jgi:hypothetical protein
MSDKTGIEWTDATWRPGQTLRREMLRFFGLQWCRGCRAWLIADAVLPNQGVCREHANAEYRAAYARDSRAIRARVYARKRDVDPLPVEAQEILTEWFEGRCAYCENRATTWDHIIPVRDGGRTVPGNVVPACNACNSSKKCADVLDWCDRTGRDPSRVLDVLLLAEAAA